MLKIFVSIITFNNDTDTISCLQSLDKLQKINADLDVIVIDNASDKPFTIPYDSIFNFKLQIIRNNDNLGFAAGHNIAIKYALTKGADYILILNNDTILDNKLLKNLPEEAELNKNAGIIVPKIYFERGFEFHREKYSEKDLGNILWFAGGFMDWANIVGKNRGVDEIDKGQFDSTEESELATGCCMLINSKVFLKSGYFDERYFLYYEDSDFTMRIKENGFKVIYAPKAILWHKNAGSSGGSGSLLQDYYISRNRLLFGFKYAPIRTKIALFRESLSFIIKGRNWQKIGVRDFYLKRFGKGSFRN